MHGSDRFGCSIGMTAESVLRRRGTFCSTYCRHDSLRDSCHINLAKLHVPWTDYGRMKAKQQSQLNDLFIRRDALNVVIDFDATSESGVSCRHEPFASCRGRHTRESTDELRVGN